MQIRDYLDDRNIRYWSTGKNVSDGWIGLQCRWCFPMGTLVLTNDGLKSIEKIKSGDKVISRNGKKNSVIRTWERKLDTEDLIQYFAYGMIGPAKCTTNHEIFTAEIIYGRHIGGYHEKRCKNIRGHQTWYSGKVQAGLLVGNSYKRKNIWMELPDIKPTKNSIVKDAYILGLYCAEGFIDGKPPRTVAFALHKKEKHLAQKIHKHFGKSAIQYFGKDKNSMTVSVHSVKHVPRFLECGKGSQNKKAPKDILYNSNKKTIQDYIDGVFDGDGHYRKDGHCSLGITSPHLALQVSILLRRLGFPTSITFTNSYIGNDGIKRKAVYTVEYNKNWKQKQRHKNIRKIKGKWYGRLKKAERKRKLKCYVYNLSVENDPTYIANGSVVKNCGDPSNHLGVHLQTNAVSCFRCGKHSLVKLVMSIDRVGFEEAKAIIAKYGGGRLFSFQRQEIPKDRPAKVVLPGKQELLPIHKQYLESRNFDAEKMYKKYQFTCVGPVGDYKLRICVPFFAGKKIVTFQSRDITGMSDIPYLPQPSNEAIIPVKQTLYNIQTCKDTILVVEGVLDVWRIGDGCVSTSGIQFTSTQAKLLTSFKRVFILFDTEQKAQEQANDLGNKISAHTFVEILQLDKGDPGDLSPSDAKSLRREVFGK